MTPLQPSNEMDEEPIDDISPPAYTPSNGKWVNILLISFFSIVLVVTLILMTGWLPIF